MRQEVYDVSLLVLQLSIRRFEDFDVVSNLIRSI